MHQEKVFHIKQTRDSQAYDDQNEKLMDLFFLLHSRFIFKSNSLIWYLCFSLL